MNHITHSKEVLEEMRLKREGFIESCESLKNIAVGYRYMISRPEWRELMGNFQTKFATVGEREKEKPVKPNFPNDKQTKQSRINFADNHEHGIRMYSQRPEIFFELIFVYLVQEWQVFLYEINGGKFEKKEDFSANFEQVKKKWGVKDFPPELEQMIGLYVGVRNHLQHSRRKLRSGDMVRLKVKEFELLYDLDGRKKKYKEGDTVIITAATVFEAYNNFIKAAGKLVP